MPEMVQISIDPRIRDRRVAVSRRQGRRRLIALGSAAAVFVSVGWLAGVWHPPLSRAKTVHAGAQERSPVGQVLGGERWALVDAGGRVLARAALPWPTLPVLKVTGDPGPQGSTLGRSWRGVLDAAWALEGWTGGRATAVTLVNGQGLELALQSAGMVVLGDDQQLPEKLATLSTVLAQVDTRGVTRIDVRVPAVAALTRG